MSVTAQVATSIDVAAATNAGQPIVVSQPQHASSTAILKLAATLTGEPVAAPPPVNGEAASEESAVKGRGLFRRRKEASA